MLRSICLLELVASGGAPAWRSLAWSILAGAFLGLLLAGALQALRAVLSGHFQSVVPGCVYRSGQPSPCDLERLSACYGLRAVVNLRGDFEPRGDYEAERRTAERLRLQYIEVGLWANRMPPARDAQRLLEVLEVTPKPLLLHCHSGIDRSGLAAGMALLLLTDASVAEAQQ
jgi:protein tyrosine/serine phosphatase